MICPVSRACDARARAWTRAAVCAFVLTSCASATQTPVAVPAVSPVTRAAAGPTSFDAVVMAYNILYQYRQVPDADGSFPAWVCQMYPHVVDHPELRWEHRFPAVVATIEAEAPDVLGLSEMRGGIPVAADPSDGDPPQDPSHGPALIHDMTRWMRDESSVRYAWISVLDVEPATVEEDPQEAGSWPGAECRRDMSRIGCARYEPRADHYSTKSFLTYRTDRFRALESGAIEIPTSRLSERRFVPWARLEERDSGVSFVVVVAHLDPFSGAHRVEGARRIVRLLERYPGTPSVVMGDLNAHMDEEDECECGCRARELCECPDEIMAGCRGQSVHRVLTRGERPEMRLVDTYLQAGGSPSLGTARPFSVAPGSPRWTSSEPCWPARLAGGTRGPAPPVTIGTGGRIDYVFASPDVGVISASIVSPRMPTVDVDGESRTVHPSDHLPVTATLRVGARESGGGAS